MVTFPDKFCKAEFENLDNGYVKLLDPEDLMLKDNITLFNISIL